MSQKSPLQNYRNFSKLFNQTWLILVVISFGIIIMQLISGNLKRDNLETALNLEDFGCEQTQLNEVTPLPREPLETAMEISIIDTRTELVQTAQTKNSIPQITKPKFEKVDEISKCMSDGDELVAVEVGSSTKLYPIKLLAQHLLVNDSIGDTPFVVSYCVLCNTVKVYDRKAGDDILTFGNTGLLYKNSDVFYDDKTESLWSQFTGQAIVGENTAMTLTPLKFRIITYSKAKDIFPDTDVMNFDTGFRANYSDVSYKEFALTENIVAPIKNKNIQIPDKSEILGFKYNDKYYAVETNKIKNGEKFEIEGKQISGSLDRGEILLEVEGSETEFTKSYWYVWSDFYPETVLL